MSKTLIEKLASQPTASLNNVLEHVSQVDTMLNSKKQPTQVTFGTIDDKQREGGGGSNDQCCYTCGDVEHPAHTCPTKEKVMAAWPGKTAATKNGTEKKEKFKEETCRGSHGGRKKGCNGSRVEENNRAST